MNFPVIEMFASIQGEGRFTGVPSIFIRVSGCNLRCCFKGSICDTPYSSYDPEKSKYKTINDVVDDFNKIQQENPHIHNLVITGGEPMLYKEGLDEFLKKVYYKDLIITIETNGTLEPLKSFPDHGKYIIDLYSVSPKLSTSEGDANGKLSKDMVERHKKTRINIQNLHKYIEYSKDCQFKFVYSGEECEEEIKKLFNDINNTFGNTLTYSPENIMLMPEGITNEQLQKSRVKCAEICIKNGWQYTDRTHIIIWGDKRGV